MSGKTEYGFFASTGTSVRMLRGKGDPKIVGGLGGWDVEDRPRRVGLTIWKGRDPWQMDIPIMFDGYASRESQEHSIRVLNQMAAGSDLQEPPTVIIDGHLPIEASGVKWVITGIDYGDEVIWAVDKRDNGFRLRQDAVVHVTQYNPEDSLKVQNKGKLLGGKPRLITVKPGDDLRSISQRYYGTPTRWKEIQAANPKALRDPKSIVRYVGKQIRIP